MAVLVDRRLYFPLLSIKTAFFNLTPQWNIANIKMNNYLSFCITKHDFPANNEKSSFFSSTPLAKK